MAANSGAFPLAIAAFKIGVRAGANQAGAASKYIIDTRVVDTNVD
jgi:hypothetical protein